MYEYEYNTIQCKPADIQMYRHTERDADRYIERHTQTNRNTNRQTYIQTNK